MLQTVKVFENSVKVTRADCRIDEEKVNLRTVSAKVSKNLANFAAWNVRLCRIIMSSGKPICVFLPTEK